MTVIKKSTAKKVVIKKVDLKSGSGREDLYEVGKNKPPKQHQFSATNQPDPKSISKGMLAKKFTRDVIREMLQMPYKFTDESQVKQQLVKAFGEEVLAMPVGQVMILQQMQRAILKGDSTAVALLLDQSLGKQVQAVQNVGADGNDIRPIILTVPKGINFSLPSNIDGEGEPAQD